MTLIRNDKRLLQIADDLLTVKDMPNGKFYMGFWKESNCKTTACAIGWYCTLHPYANLKLMCDGKRWNGVQNYEPILKSDPTKRGFDAVAEYFGLRRFVAERLFSKSQGHKTAIQVSRNIHRFLNKNIVPGYLPVIEAEWKDPKSIEKINHRHEHKYWATMKAEKAAFNDSPIES